MLRRLLLISLVIFSFFGCKKVNDSPQWDVSVLGPVFHARLSIDQLIGDTNIITTSDGSQILNYDKTFSNFNLDSIYQINDTTIPTIVTFPNFPSTIHPGSQFYSNNNNVKLGVGNVQLREAIISTGKIKLTIKNTLQSKVYFTYTIPQAIKNNLPFTVLASVDSGSITNPKFFTGEYDFSGYDVTLTGSTGNQFNSITYNVVAHSAPAPEGHDFNVAGLDTLVNLKTTLESIRPFFVLGYLGQEETHEIKSDYLGIGKLVQNGTILLDSIKMDLDIINYIGADEQLYLSYFRSKNNRTGNAIDLVAPPLIQHYLNINRASRMPWLQDPLIPTHFSVSLDKNNSNIRQLLENMPDSISYDMDLNLNPLGNVSGSNDFAYSDRLVSTHLKVRMPLRFAMDQLTLSDTADFKVSDKFDVDPVGSSYLTLIGDNGFPFDMNLQMILLDKTKTRIDTLIVPDLIRSAPIDINYRATGIQRTEIKIPIDETRKNKLKNTEHVNIRLKFNTPNSPQLIQMYSDYHLDLKLIADGIYTIR